MRISDWSSDVCSSDLKSRNTHPKYNAPGLKSVISGYDSKKLGNDVGRTIHDHSKGESHHGNASELAIEKEAEIQAGLRRYSGRTQLRERGWQYVEIWGVGGS